MKKDKAKTLIKKKLIKMAANPKSMIIFAYIDTTYAGSEIVPFLNIFAASVFEDDDINQAIIDAEKNDDLEFIYDIIDTCEESLNEINLSEFFPDWPDNIKDGENQIVEIINDSIKDNLCFENISKLFFHHVDCTEFIKIINR